jgi:hypothetical protein
LSGSLFKIHKFFSKYQKKILILFYATHNVFKKNLRFFLNHQKLKKHPQKLLRIPQIHFFFLTALTAQTAQTAQIEEFLFQNMAY